MEDSQRETSIWIGAAGTMVLMTCRDKDTGTYTQTAALTKREAIALRDLLNKAYTTARDGHTVVTPWECGI